MPDYTEVKTRALLINPQLEKAGWNLSDRSQVRFEVPVQGYDPTPWNGFTDFSLYHPAGRVLAADVVSDVDVPAFDRATMDGYAVVANSTEANPILAPISTITLGLNSS